MSLFRGGAVAALAMGMVIGFGAASPAAANVECIAAAYTNRGNPIPATRGAAEREFERAACRAALRRCEERLERVRFEIDRRLRNARCEVRRVGFLDAGFSSEGRYRDDGRACNFVACDERYKTFRASDCTYKPTVNTRRRCTL